MPPPSQRRLFALETGVSRPLDLALGEGDHELPDLGINLRFTGGELRVAWQGFGPTAFLLPGARRLQKGAWSRADAGTHLSWAGRDWAFLAHELPGDTHAPPRGASLNSHGAGRPLNAVLLLTEGADRGNFYRMRSANLELADGVSILGSRSPEGPVLTLTLAASVATDHVRLNGAPLPPATSSPVVAEDLLAIGATSDTDALAAVALFAD